MRSIAFDPNLFTRCVTAMVDIVEAEDIREQSHGTEFIVSLFSLFLSGTHATIDQRLQIVEALVHSPDEKQRTLGVLALRAALEAWYFKGAGLFEFGARSRDYGYWPRTAGEAQHWFRKILELTQSLACSGTPVAMDARAALAVQFRGLWDRGGVHDELARVCEAIHKQSFWPAGWLAVRRMLESDGPGMAADHLAALNAIEAQLRPTDLAETIRAVVFSDRLSGLDFTDSEEHPDEDFEARWARTEGLAHDLGKAAATDDEILDALLPDIVRSDGRLWPFGGGLADGAADAEAMWDRLVVAFATADQTERNPLVLRGFLRKLQIKDPLLANALLDSAVDHETLAHWYPALAVAVDIDAAGVARLRRSLTLGEAPANMYRYLAFGRATDPIPAPEVRHLVLAIARMTDGFDTATEILYMRLKSDEDSKSGIADELADAGRQLLRKYAFTSRRDSTDHRLERIAVSCLTDPRGAELVLEVCNRLKAAVIEHKTQALWHDHLLQGIFRAQPVAALDVLCAGTDDELQQGLSILESVATRKNVLGHVPEDDLLRWCDQDPDKRYPAIARVVISADQPCENEPLQWTSLALRLLNRAPDAGAVLQEFISLSGRRAWRGSLAGILEAHAKLLDDLNVFPHLAGSVAQARARLKEEIEFHRRIESGMDRHRDERFE